jgi:hypothetical protein
MSRIDQLGPVVVLDTATYDVLDYDIAALTGGGFAVSLVEAPWTSRRYDPVIRDAVWTAEMIRTGTENEHRVDHYNSRITWLDPAITGTDDGGFVTAFRQQWRSFADATQIYARSHDADGTRTDFWRPNPLPNSIADDTNQEDPRLVSLAGGTLAALWVQEAGSYARVFDPDGTALTAAREIDKGGATSARLLDAAPLDTGGFVAALRMRDSAANRSTIELHRFDAQGNPVGSPTTVAGLFNPGIITEAALIGLPGGGFAMAMPAEYDVFSRYAGIHLATFTAAGVQRGDAARVDDVRLWNASDAGLAMTRLQDGGFALAFTAAIPDPASTTRPIVDLAVRLFDDDGTARGPSQLFESPRDRFGDTMTEGQPDLVQLANGTLVLTWMAEGAGSVDDLHAIRLSLPEPGRMLQGGPGPDRLVGGTGNDTIAGAGGNDSLFGAAGADRIIGEAGDDVIYGGDGADTLNGGTGDDIIFGGASAADLRDVIFGGDGRDQIDAGHGNDLVYAGNGNDTVEGGFGVDEIQGQGGDDVLTGSAFSDLIFGGDGRDFINGGFGSDRLNGGAGADRFYHLGIRDHGSDWVQDFSAAEGDRLLFGAAAGRGQFQVNFAETPGAGLAGVAEAFVIYRPTGQILWALVDGGAQGEILLQAGGASFDLLA